MSKSRVLFVGSLVLVGVVMGGCGSQQATITDKNAALGAPMTQADKQASLAAENSAAQRIGQQNEAAIANSGESTSVANAYKALPKLATQTSQ